MLKIMQLALQVAEAINKTPPIFIEHSIGSGRSNGFKIR
jgi:hypothetical protein